MGGHGGEQMKFEPQGEGGRPMCPPLTSSRGEGPEAAGGLPQGGDLSKVWRVLARTLDLHSGAQSLSGFPTN